MTRERKLEILTSAFNQATRHCGNPGARGASPRKYAQFTAGKMREALASYDGSRPLVITPAEVLELADNLDAGEFDRELAALMGYA